MEIDKTDNFHSVTPGKTRENLDTLGSLDNYSSNSEKFAPRLHIKILKKNKALSQFYKDLACDAESQSENVYSKIHSICMSQREKSKDPPKIPEEIFELDKHSCLTAYIVKGKSLKNMIPDYELIKNSELFKQYDLSDTLPNQEYFNLARIKYYSGETSVASFLLSRVPSNEVFSNTYKLWSLMVSYQITHFVHSVDERKEFVCCGNREKLSRQRIEKGIADKLSKLDYRIEALWGLLEMSLDGSLEIGVDISPSKFYAAKIKDISQYYGYLAWAKINLAENAQNGIKILDCLVQNYKSKPEAYFMLWEIYCKKKEHRLAKNLMEKACLDVDKEKYTGYYVLFCLKLAKITYILGNFEDCLEILYTNYLKLPVYTVFLYHICKYCVQSGKQETIGLAIGLLKELTRISDNSRVGCVYYWLSRAYQAINNNFKAYIYASKANSSLKFSEKNKNLELKKIIFDLKRIIEKISVAQNHLKNKSFEYIDEIQLDQIREFNRPVGDIIQCDYLLGSGKSNLALEIVKALTDLDQICVGAYLRVFHLEKAILAIEYYKKLIKKCVNPQVPAQDCIKSCLIFAKFLFRTGNHHKSLYVLRSLAKALPNLPEANLPYCRALQESYSEEDLASAYQKIGIVSQGPKTYKPFKIRSLIESFASLTPYLFSPKGSKLTSSKKTQISDKFSHKSFIENSPESSLFELTISSHPKFLILIAKYLYMLKTQKREALLALDDYIELLKFKKTAVDEKLHKALNLKIKLSE